jgi:hypothetical protein
MEWELSSIQEVPTLLKSIKDDSAITVLTNEPILTRHNS